MINVAFITDENFILPTSVAIASLIKNNSKNDVKIHVVTPGVSEESQKKLRSLSTSKAQIIIHAVENNFLEISTGELFENIPANHSALMKFNLPKILGNVDKLLYLDGDLLVTGDVSKLYDIDLGDNIVAAVSDNIANWHMKELKLTQYFNSGVMLLNLKKMRDENYTEKLIDYRINGFNRFMDQDTFNVVFANKVKFLPFKYNTMYSIMECNSLKEIENLYDLQDVSSYDELVEQASIIHFSSNKKPWKYILPGIGLLYRYYLNFTPFKNCRLNYIGKASELFNVKKYLKYNTDKKQPLISIIVPAFNVEDSIEECLNSLINQTLKEIEIIVVDDASTDHTANILDAYAKNDSRLVVYHCKENAGTCAARKQGGLMAKGQFVMFVDGDDKLELSACEELYEKMVATDADIIQFKTKIVVNNSSRETVKDFDKYINRSYEFLTSEEIINKSFIEKTLSRNLWNRIYKRIIIEESFKEIEDGYYLKSEDLYASLLIAYHAKNMIFVDKEYYIYSIGLGITSTTDVISVEKFKRISTGIDVVSCIVNYIVKNRNDQNICELLQSLFSHCFTENNWWIKFVSFKDFEECINLCFEKYKQFFEQSNNKLVAEALARSLDKIFFTIQTQKSLTCSKLFELFESIKYNIEIFEENSYMYNAYSMENKNAVNVVVNINNKDFPYLAVLIKSICENANKDRLYNIYVFGNGLYNKYIDKISNFSKDNIRLTIIKNCDEVSKNIQKGINGNVAYKIYAAYFLSLLSKIIYISYDSVVLSDIAELFDEDMQGNALAAPNEYTLNTGVANGNFVVNTMLINTKEFNKINLKDIYLKCGSKLSEREFFNVILKNNVKILDDKWCFQWHIPYKYLNGKLKTDFNILHFGSDDKPWTKPEHVYAEKFWEYARKTDFYEEIIFNNIKKEVPKYITVEKESSIKPLSNWQRFKNSCKSIGFFPSLKKALRILFKRGRKK